MIIFLYGLDNYRSRQKLNEIIEEYSNENNQSKKIPTCGLNLKYFDAKKIDFQEFQDEIGTISMFKEKKLIILTNVFFNSDIEKNFLDFLKNKKEIKDTVLFYEEEKINEKSPLFNFLIKNGKSEEFQLLEVEKLKNWIKNEFNKYQIKISLDILNDLANFIGNDLWQLSNEIKKIALYKIKTKELKITKKDFNLLIKPKIESAIFDTIDAISSQSKKRALNLLHRHLEKGDSPIYLFSMIKFQFSNILVVKDLLARKKSFAEILTLTSLHPYTVKKSYKLSQKFTLEQLQKIYKKIFQLDLKLKTGKIEPVLALDLFLSEI